MGTTDRDGETAMDRTTNEGVCGSTPGIGAVELYWVGTNAARDDERLRALTVRQV